MRTGLAVAPASTSSVSSPRTRARERADRAEQTHELLGRIDQAPAAEKEQLIDQLIDVNMPVAESIAARYRRRGIPDEDLEQVAYLALVRVAHHYDHARGHDFLSYAVPSIRGEVRRYFRDQGWMVRPPRGIQEMQGRIAAVESELATRLGHPPTADELARELDEPLAEVEEAMAANGCFTPTSLDQVPSSDTATIADQLGERDAGIDAAEARVVLTPVVRRLTERERKILDMRFFAQCTQQEIADEIGVTQMQVSRLLSSLLRRLRIDLEAGAAAPHEE
jgi:RNA polymerase sigma-B factor